MVLQRCNSCCLNFLREICVKFYGQNHNVIYRKDDEVIIFYQTVTSEYNSIWNTENSDFETIIIDGNEAIYFKDNHNYKTIIWYNGEYVISIGSNIDKNSLLNLTRFVQKVE